MPVFCSCFQPGRFCMCRRSVQTQVQKSGCRLLIFRPDCQAGVIKLFYLTWLFLPPCSSALGASALKAAAAAAASSSTKRKDAGSDSRSEKKKKSALEEIMEVEKMYFLLFCLCLFCYYSFQLIFLKLTECFFSFSFFFRWRRGRRRSWTRSEQITGCSQTSWSKSSPRDSERSTTRRRVSSW